MKKIIIGVLSIVAISLSYFANTRYQQHKLVETITPHVKHASIRLSNAIKNETDEGIKITYKELFEKLESDIAEIDKHILYVQTAATSENKDVTGPVIHYLQNSQATIRMLLSYSRKVFEVAFIKDSVDRSVGEFRTADYTITDTMYGIARKAIVDYNIAVKERGEVFAETINALKRMKEARTRVAKIIPGDALVDPAILDAVLNKYEPKVHSPVNAGKK